MKYLDYWKNKRKIKLEELKEINNLKFTKEIKLDEFKSDKGFLREKQRHYWKHLFMRKIMRRSFIWCEIYLPDNVNIIRMYEEILPNVLSINGGYYLFHPKCFRYINGYGKLEFYEDTPFATMMQVDSNGYKRTIDANALKSVLTSKHVSDAIDVSPADKFGIKEWIVVIAVGVLALVNCVMLYMIYDLKGVLSALAVT